ncbi:putative reverse transcriptase domain, reverse transcriptase zinc-binding domain protein [Tanacetum coccineum]
MQLFKLANGLTQHKGLRGFDHSNNLSPKALHQQGRQNHICTSVTTDETCMIAHSLIRAKPAVRMKNNIGQDKDMRVSKEGSCGFCLHGHFLGKRGLQQGDPLSPYLFTLIMEVLTLMLQRRVRNSDLFTYHRYCSNMELINLCFADDLFLFAHGDVNLARVIMDTLDEFKLASGLTPSLPKSTAYF